MDIYKLLNDIFGKSSSSNEDLGYTITNYPPVIIIRDGDIPNDKFIRICGDDVFLCKLS